MCLSVNNTLAQEKNNFFNTSQISGQDTTGTGSGSVLFKNSSGPNFILLLLKTVGSLIVITLLIYLVILYFKKFYMGKRGLSVNSSSMKIIGTLFLAPKKTIYLVKIGKKVVVLGVTESNINYLSELNDEELGEINIDKVAVSNGSFSFHLNGFLSKLMRKEKALK